MEASEPHQHVQRFVWCPARQNSRLFSSNGTLGVRDGVNVRASTRVGRRASVAVMMSVRVTVRCGAGVDVEVGLIRSVTVPAFGQTVLVVEQ